MTARRAIYYLLTIWMLDNRLLCPALAFSFPSPPSSSASNQNQNRNNNDSFSLSDYRKARALETVQSMDASRLHFQIMFVDDDNSKGRIAEGLLARVAEYNDALFMLFPASSTIEGSRNAPVDAAAPDRAVAICDDLGLCGTRSRMMGTSFDLSYLDEYDLIIAMDDDIRSLMLRSLTVDDQEYYAPKLRLLTEFLSPEFCSVSSTTSNIASGKQPPGTQEDDDQATDNTQPTTIDKTIDEDASTLLDMLDSELRERVEPCSNLIIGRSSNVLQTESLEYQTAALILASSGVTKFCLDTMEAQFETAFDSLLQMNFHSQEHLDSNITAEQADDQLRRCSHSVSGYFSPKQRRTRFERHMTQLRIQLNDAGFSQ